MLQTFGWVLFLLAENLLRIQRYINTSIITLFVFYVVFLSKDLISVFLFCVYLHWSTVTLWMAASNGKISVDFRYDILSHDAYCDPVKASIS
jgi:hypothetical protein